MPPELGNPPVYRLRALVRVWSARSQSGKSEMPEATAAAVAPVPTPAATALAALRFLLTNRLGVILLG